jgi:uncharacterized glyoxalase superfamily protein PhnB
VRPSIGVGATRPVFVLADNTPGYQHGIGLMVMFTHASLSGPPPPVGSKVPFPPPGMVPAGWDNKIMHTCLRIGDANVMASDGCSDGPHFQGFSLALTAVDATDAGRTFDALAEGGQVQMPLGKTFWSPCFGMVTDRFGVGWMVTVA